jgi:hypothetical protein
MAKGSFQNAEFVRARVTMIDQELLFADSYR